MQNNEDYLLIGTLTKTHGVNGEMVLKLDNLDADDIEEMGPLFIEFDGLMVPFFVKDFFAKSSVSLVIKFEDINTNEQATEFINCRVFSPVPVTGSENTYFPDPSSIIDYKVTDKKYGDIGNVKEFINNPVNPLLRIIKNKREILIPVNNEFILKIDDKNKNIVIDAPEGLIDLYS